MEEVKDIILNVYTLSVPPTDAQNATTSSSTSTNSNQQQQQRSHSTTTSSWSSFFVSQMLPSMGMGAYHTSLRMGSNHDSPYTITYTFVANQGIVSSRSRSNDAQQQQQLPSHATFKEEIVLGACSCTRGQVQDILQRLSQYYFTKTSYHLVHRNCNHFTETFATALVHYSAFMNNNNNGGTITSPRSLVVSNFYPDWINRLAHTGAVVVATAHDADIRPCRAPWNEAYHAVTNTTTFLEENPATTGSGGGRWGSISSKILSGSKSTSTATTKKKQEKKELTEAQQKLLDKIRKK